jgi:hypothetical protein
MAEYVSVRRCALVRGHCWSDWTKVQLARMQSGHVIEPRASCEWEPIGKVLIIETITGGSLSSLGYCAARILAREVGLQVGAADCLALTQTMPSNDKVSRP